MTLRLFLYDHFAVLAIEMESETCVSVRQIERTLQAFPLWRAKTCSQVSSYAVARAHELGLLDGGYLKSRFDVLGSVCGIEIACCGVGHVGAIV